MPVHVEEMKSDVTVLDGNLPLTENQKEELIALVLQRLEEKQRREKGTMLRNRVAPSLHIGE